MRWAAVALLGLLAPLTGCRIARPVGVVGMPAPVERGSDQDASHQSKQEARHAWQEVTRQYSNRAFTPAFADGFEEGFTNRRWHGTQFSLPTAPPAWYRSHANTAEGRAEGWDYLNGFKYGSEISQAVSPATPALPVSEAATGTLSPGPAKIFSMSQTLPSMLPTKPRVAVPEPPLPRVIPTGPVRPEPVALPKAPEPVPAPVPVLTAPVIPPLPPMPGVPIPYVPEAPPSLPPFPSNNASRPLASPIIPVGGIRQLELPPPKLTFPLPPVFKVPPPLPPAANPG